MTLADTQLGCAIATKKRELEAAAYFMSREERERMIWKLNKMNEEEALATGDEEHTGMSGEVDAAYKGFLYTFHSY